MLKPFAPVRRNQPIARGARPARHAAENPANNCTPCPQKANSEIASSTRAPHSFAAPRRPGDLPAARSHPKADTAPDAEYADCSKDFPPSNSPGKYAATRAATKTESAPPNPAASDRSRSRQIPSDTEANPHTAPEF